MMQSIAASNPEIISYLPERMPDVEHETGVNHPWQFRMTSHLFDWKYVPAGGVGIEGANNVSAKESMYISADHESLFDIPLFDRALLKATGQTSYYVGRDNLLRPFPMIGRQLGKHLLRIGIVPVSRDLSLPEQPGFIAYLDEIIAQNNRVVWHPEGTRTKHPQHELDFKKLHLGLGIMAARHGTAIVPTAAKREGRNRVVFEEPVEVEKIEFDITDPREVAVVRRDIARPAMKKVYEGMLKARQRAYGITV